MTNLKYCDITQSYTQSSGGIRTYLDAKRQYLKENTDFQHILIIPGDKDRAYFDQYSHIYQIKALQIPGCHPYRFIVRLDKVVSILYKENPDFIELGCPYFLPWSAFLYRLIRKCIVMGFYHTDYPAAYIKPAIQALLGKRISEFSEKLGSWYVKQIYGRCNGIFTSSTIITRQLNSLGLSYVHYLPLGVDLDLFHPDKRNEVLRKSLGIQQGEKLMIYSGRLDSEKRIDILLSALKEIPAELPYKFLFVGEGPLRNKIIEAMRTNDRIIFLPYQSDKHVLAQLLASSDLYVTAGPFETFGLSVLEAQACGLPVVGVRSGALLERVRPSLGSLAEPDVPGDLANHLRKIFQQPLKNMGTAARRHVEQNYSWASTFNRIINLSLSAQQHRLAAKGETISYKLNDESKLLSEMPAISKTKDII